MESRSSAFSLAIIVLLSLLVIGLFVYLLKPFFTVIAWASILAFFFYPLYRKLRTILWGNNIISAMILIFSTIFFLFIPLFLATLQLIYQIEEVLANIDKAFFEELFNRISALKAHPLWGRLYKELSPYLENLQATIYEQLSHLLRSTFNLLRGFLQATFSIAFKIVLTIFTFYYFLTDGEKIVFQIKELIPGPEQKKREIFDRINLILKAVLYGSLLTALVQGLIATVIYLILGISGYLIWGSLTAAASFIPFLGTSLVWGPLSIYLMVKGSLMKGTILFLASALTVAQIDSLIKPFFIGSKAKLHNLLVLFSALGGILSFGFLGIFLGPLILGLFLSVIEIYKSHLQGNSISETIGSPSSDTPADIDKTNKTN